MSDVKKPLVTFALFAYNQEKFIREAVEAALSQSYEPLEIILSDDCSSDRTFEIMEHMASKYRGPHTIKIYRNLFNLGTASHVETVFKISSGELFIVAAGDDISLPNRATKLTEAWIAAEKPAGVVHSRMVQFQEDPYIEWDLPFIYERNQDITLALFAKEWKIPIYAQTCAYTREIFEFFSPLTGGSIIEDEPLMFRALAIGEFVPVDLVLVRQRKLPQSAGQGFSVERPAQWNRFIHSKVTALSTILRDISLAKNVDANLIKKINRSVLRKMRILCVLYYPFNDYGSFALRLSLSYSIMRHDTIEKLLWRRLKFVLIFFGFKDLRLYRHLHPYAKRKA